MLHVLYGLVCCKNCVKNEVCRIVKNIENLWLNCSFT